MEYTKLTNGVDMPLLGYGVFRVPADECERCVSDALSVGYRLIDTAQVYGNEEGVGSAWRKSGIARNELFIVTKIWITNSGEERAAESINESLRKLQTDYVDLLLIHQPYGDVFGTWRAMEKAYKDGKTRAIGVSNFQAGRFLRLLSLCRHKTNGKPIAMQHVGTTKGHSAFFSRNRNKNNGMGSTGRTRCRWYCEERTAYKLGQKYGKSAAQVALRWLIQRGIVAIPKSSHIERMKQNFDVFDFSLTNDDMAQIETMNQSDTGFRNYTDPTYIKRLIEF